MLCKLSLRISHRLSGLILPPSLADISNSIGYLNCNSTPTMSITEKLNLYNTIDVFSRDALFTLANDYQLGLPLGVVAVSILLRGAFL